MTHTRKSRGFIEFLKIRYRPLICPFGKLLSYVSCGDKVTDIGCGSGQFCLLVARKTKASAITGIEISPRLIENASHQFQQLHNMQISGSFLVYDGITLPEAVRESDVVFLIDVLHHVPPAMQSCFIQHLYETMRPGAQLVLKDIDAGSVLVWFNRLHDLLLSGSVGHEWTLMKTRSVCRRMGFDVKASYRKRMFCYPHFILHLIKPDNR